jgi:hypothetical protein
MLQTLTKMNTSSRELNMVQDNIIRVINPIVAQQILSGNQLTSIPLSVGPNAVNHLLGHVLQGWFITRMRSNFSQIYDTQDTNPVPAITLTLNSSVAVVVDIFVF